MPSITDGHSLFATSSAHCTMALAHAWVARLFRAWRRIGFTSFPKVPRRSADRQMGLGTHYPPDVHGERVEVHDLQLPNIVPFWPQLPPEGGDKR